jgi:hypothetical protein
LFMFFDLSLSLSLLFSFLSSISFWYDNDDEKANEL